MSKDLANFGDNAVATVTRGAGSDDSFGIKGRYEVICYDKDGNIKWEDYADNVVTAAGKIDMFNNYFGTTGTGGGTASGVQFLGLIGYTGTAATVGSLTVGATYIITSLGTTTNTQWQAITGDSTVTYVVGSVFICRVNSGTGGGTVNLIGTFLAADTMSSHAGWVEVGINSTNDPGYSGNRQSLTWSTATDGAQVSPGNIVTKTVSANNSFSITSTGTVGGCFINSGSGASATKITGTTGVLYSAGAFSAGQKAVTSGDSLAVTYKTTATS